MMDVSLSKADKDFDIEGGRLRFLQPNYGLFECFATNSQGSSYSGINLTKHRAAVDSAALLQLLQGPTDLVVPENSDIRFSCQVGGASSSPPRPVTFNWSFNTKAVRTLRPDWRVERVSDSQENLVIDRVTAEDVGTVGCLVSSDAVRLYQEGSIAIKAVAEGDDDQLTDGGREMSAAKIVSNFSGDSLRLLEGESLSLVCEAEGVPQPTVTWTDNGRLSELVLTAVDKSQDGSRHTCLASNEAGRDEQTVAVAVYERSRTTGGAEEAESPRHVVLGSELVLTCVFHTDDKWVLGSEAQVQWEKDGADLDEGRFTMEASLNSNVLHIGNVTAEDGGDYSCIVVTPLDNATRLWSVEVVTPASIIRFEPEDKKLVLAGTMAELICEAGGWPAPNVTWFLNGTELMQTAAGGAERSSGGGSLRLEQVEADQAGQYSCKVSNRFGVEARSVQLAVASPTTPLPGKRLN